jgi:stage II sporulation protein R
MKGFAVVLIAIVVIVFAFSFMGADKDDFLRIHIRADSDSAEAQNVKLKVKEAVVNYLTPLVANCNSVEESKKVAKEHLLKIAQISKQVVSANGYDYEVNVYLKKEHFPARYYGNAFLDEGVYDALIIELGDGKGQNWWCVVYPPLCFVGVNENGTNAVRYRSKLIEIINKYYDSYQE